MAFTKDQLQKLRAEKKTEFGWDGKTPRIVVNLGTCGIAAGANRTLAAIQDELKAQGMTDVEVKTTGCFGYCAHEPSVQVFTAEIGEVVYGEVDPETARELVTKHVKNGRLLDGHLMDSPSVDIIS